MTYDKLAVLVYSRELDLCSSPPGAFLMAHPGGRLRCLLCILSLPVKLA